MSEEPQKKNLVKVYNLTDVSTPQLEQRGLVNKTLAVYDKLIEPGEEAEIDADNLIAMRDANHYAEFKALAIKEVPHEYVLARGKITGAPMVSGVVKPKEEVAEATPEPVPEAPQEEPAADEPLSGKKKRW